LVDLDPSSSPSYESGRHSCGWKPSRVLAGGRWSTSLPWWRHHLCNDCWTPCAASGGNLAIWFSISDDEGIVVLFLYWEHRLWRSAGCRDWWRRCQVMPVGLVLRLIMPIWQVLRTTDLPWWCRQQFWKGFCGSLSWRWTCRSMVVTASEARAQGARHGFATPNVSSYFFHRVTQQVPSVISWWGVVSVFRVEALMAIYFTHCQVSRCWMVALDFVIMLLTDFCCLI
jgi:hypothetical protein